MEQLRMSTGKDSERVVQILTDLMKTNKEFQIMITVPAVGTAAAQLKAQEEKPSEGRPQTAAAIIAPCARMGSAKGAVSERFRGRTSRA